MRNTTWDLIIIDKCLDSRVGDHDEPKEINRSILPFSTKEELLVKYKALIKEYNKKSYDSEMHSQGAVKYYYKEYGMDILTQLLVYHDGGEVGTGLFDA
jgi:hypothetical protein